MRAFLVLIAVGGTIWAVSLVAPDSLKDRLSAAVSSGNFSVGQKITDSARQAKEKVSEVIIPKSPQEKRAELIARLEETIKEIEAAQEEKFNLAAPSKAQELIKESEELIVKLKQENEKDKKGAVRSFLQATADALGSIGGNGSQEQDEVCGVSPE